MSEIILYAVSRTQENIKAIASDLCFYKDFVSIITPPAGYEIIVRALSKAEMKDVTVGD